MTTRFHSLNRNRKKERKTRERERERKRRIKYERWEVENRPRKISRIFAMGLGPFRADAQKHLFRMVREEQLKQLIE